MAEVGKGWLTDVMQSDARFLKELGVEACLIDDPFAVPLLLPDPQELSIVLSRSDHKWLKAIAVRWQQDPEYQIPMDIPENP